jgi:hypothetical protein
VNPTTEFNEPFKDYESHVIDVSNIFWKSIPQGTSTQLLLPLIQISPPSLDCTLMIVTLPWIMLTHMPKMIHKLKSCGNGARKLWLKLWLDTENFPAEFLPI